MIFTSSIVMGFIYHFCPMNGNLTVYQCLFSQNIYIAFYIIKFCILNILLSCYRQLLSSAENLCKQFEPRLGPTEHIRTKRFDTLVVFQKGFLKKVKFEKSQLTPTKA